jgi:hypothetical protein
LLKRFSPAVFDAFLALIRANWAQVEGPGTGRSQRLAAFQQMADRLRQNEALRGKITDAERPWLTGPVIFLFFQFPI